MSIFIKCIFLLGVVFNISTSFAKNYSIEKSMASNSRGVLNKNKSKRNRKKSTSKKPNLYGGYQMYNKKGEYVGAVSKNQKCVFLGNYYESESDKEYTNDINIKKITLKCRGKNEKR